MKIDKIKTLALIACAGGFLASCSSDIDVSKVSEDPYQVNDTTLAFITDKYGMSVLDSLMFSDKGSTDIYVNLSKAAASATDFTVAYDETVLTSYNAANGTHYKALPENLVTVNGAATVAAGGMKSKAVSVDYASAASLDSLGVYAIPLAVKSNGKVQTSKKGEFVLLLRDITKMPNCHKASGMQVISCMEVNNANPLHNLCYTLQKSGKLFFDQVILFSGNINYNAKTGEVYNYNNENVQHLLDYKEKYLKPLQQKGMKVILGVMGNHDRSGVANFTKAGAKVFAKELKAVLNAYDLDGVFFDDEYSNYGNNPGFEATPSSAAAARLCYECKQAMPDKLVEVYAYGYTGSLPSVDGVQPGKFVDFAIQDYGVYSDLSDSYQGLAKSGMIQASSEFARGSVIDYTTAKKIVTDGYGGTMIFSLDPNTGLVSRMNAIGQAFFGEDVVQNGSYAKDW